MSTTEIKFKTVEQGSYSGMTIAGQQLISTAADLKTYWAQLHSGSFPAPKAPRIGFTKSMVVALHLGQRSSGGHSITVTKVEDNGKEIVVTYSTKGPGGGMATMAMTQPYHVISLPKSKKPVVFQPEPTKKISLKDLKPIG